MAGHEYSMVRPKTAQNKAVLPGSPLAVQGVFLEVLRERYKASSGLQWQWDSDPTLTTLLVELGLNQETETRGTAPAVYINKLDTVVSRAVIGDRAGVQLHTGTEGFTALVTSPMRIDCVSTEAGESALLGDNVQFTLLVAQDPLQKHFGLHNVSLPSLEDTTPYERDNTRWNTPVDFQIQYWVRWIQRPLGPILQDLHYKVSSESNPSYYIDVAVNSIARSSK